jgi:hypothetical protein
MRTLIYKRTHIGDPDPETGEFGCHDCMGSVRGLEYDAVIGIGGIGPEATRHRIAGKLTWVGLGPHKCGDPKRPRVTFDHFWDQGEHGPLLKNIAPALASRMLYDGNVRILMDSLSDEEQPEVEKILDLAMDAPPSNRLNERDCRHTSGNSRPSKRRSIRVKCDRKPK